MENLEKSGKDRPGTNSADLQMLDVFLAHPFLQLLVCLSD